MSTAFPSAYVEQIGHEVRQTPDEYPPALLQIVRVFRESVTLKPAAESFRTGWQEAIRGETLPVEHLWHGAEAE